MIDVIIYPLLLITGAVIGRILLATKVAIELAKNGIVYEDMDDDNKLTLAMITKLAEQLQRKGVDVQVRVGSE